MSTHFKLIFLLTSLLLLSACGNNAQKAVNDYMQGVQKDLPPAKAPEPIPAENFEAKFQTVDTRDPFSTLEITAGVKKYPNAILQQYTLDSLKLVGILNHEHKTWAMLRAPDEKMYRVIVGSRIGNQQSLVTKISENSIFLETEQNSPNSKKESVLVLQKN
jgi:type IV pilus assembly protein PilP